MTSNTHVPPSNQPRPPPAPAPPSAPVDGPHKSARLSARLAGLHDTYTSRRSCPHSSSSLSTAGCSPARGGSATHTTRS
eukprot:365558-Chlamydomonas_euryale.AAC.27